MRERESWFPGQLKSAHRSYGRSEFTVYVDNLPNSCGVPCFKLVFSQYGVIDEAILPHRRSRRTGNRFGFFRYRNRRDASLAVANANGLHVGSRIIIVEMARYDSGINCSRSMRVRTGFQIWDDARDQRAKFSQFQEEFRPSRAKPRSTSVPQPNFHTVSSMIPNQENCKEIEKSYIKSSTYCLGLVDDDWNC